MIIRQESDICSERLQHSKSIKSNFVMRRLHRWSGGAFCLLFALFALTGIVLNHRAAWSNLDLSRRYLPDDYRHRAWNQGLLRATLPLDSGHVLLYGSGGLHLLDTLGHYLRTDNAGLPTGADHRQVRAVVSHGNRIFALTTNALYTRRRTDTRWQPLPFVHTEERFSDLTLRGDSLLVVGRNALYLAQPPYRRFTPIVLPRAMGDDGRITLFRIVWLLHSGALFGTAGRWVMDGVAAVILFLSLTGLFLLFVRPTLRHLPRSATGTRRRLSRWFGTQLRWHDLAGRKTLLLTLFCVLTGWLLRPPGLIALISVRLPAPPLTILASDNPWNDRLRMLRYDRRAGEWLLSANDGFYRFADFHTTPRPIPDAPPVSVMGLNVWQRTDDGAWIVGSFAGVYRWERGGEDAHGSFRHTRVVDATTGATLPLPAPKGMPFGRRAVSGYSADFRRTDGSSLSLVAEHLGHTSALPQPTQLELLPMSLWNVAFELHNGRLFTFLLRPDLFFIPLAGLIALIILWSGWRIRRHRRPHQSSPSTPRT